MKNNKFEKWCKDYMQKASKVLLIEDFYPINFKYGVDNKDSSAESTFHYPYKNITVGYSDELLKDWKDRKFDDVKDVLIHELFHAITDPLYSVGFDRFVTKGHLSDEREKLTDHLANIIRKNKII